VEVVSRELELVVEHHRHLRRSHVGVGEKPGALKALGLHGARSRKALAHGSQRLAQPLTGQLLTPRTVSGRYDPNIMDWDDSG
jgi:hypothetical protein